jgi:hypothetical protein
MVADNLHVMVVVTQNGKSIIWETAICYIEIAR